MGKNPQDENTESVSQVDTDEQRQKAAEQAIPGLAD